MKPEFVRISDGANKEWGRLQNSEPAPMCSVRIDFGL
jgi:hypothetical protein